MSCAPYCWTPKSCPDHGDYMPPFGRSAPTEMYVCCDNYARSDINPRHLWDEHDSTRWYTDPVGWNSHADQCEREDCARIPVPSQAGRIALDNAKETP